MKREFQGKCIDTRYAVLNWNHATKTQAANEYKVAIHPKSLQDSYGGLGQWNRDVLILSGVGRLNSTCTQTGAPGAAQPYSIVGAGGPLGTLLP